MPDTYWSLLFTFALIILALTTGIFIFLRQKRANSAGHFDDSFFLLILLLVVAILSVGTFIAFIVISSTAN